MTKLEKRLLAALEEMVDMHNAHMEKINHAASFYDAETIHAINVVPLAAMKVIGECRALQLHEAFEGMGGIDEKRFPETKKQIDTVLQTLQQEAAELDPELLNQINDNEHS